MKVKAPGGVPSRRQGLFFFSDLIELLTLHDLCFPSLPFGLSFFADNHDLIARLFTHVVNQPLPLLLENLTPQLIVDLRLHF